MTAHRARRGASGGRRARRARAAFAWAVLLTITAVPAVGQAEPTGSRATVAVEVFATGLVNPRGLVFRPDGGLLVAEAGSGGQQLVDVSGDGPRGIGRSGRVSRLLPHGELIAAVATGLPSIVAPNGEAFGPSALAFLGDELYILTTAGGRQPPGSAFRGAVSRVLPEGRLERFVDLSAHAADPSTVGRLHPPGEVPGSLLSGMTALGDRLYATDGANGQILAIARSGETARLGSYSDLRRVPAGIAAGPDGALYVAEPAESRVSRVTLDGDITVVAHDLRTPIGVAFDSDGTLYVLESGGRVLRATAGGPGDVLTEGLREPSAIAFGPDGNLYVSTLGQSSMGGGGQVARLRLAPAPARSPLRFVQLAVPWLTGIAVFGLALAIGHRFRRGTTARAIAPSREPD